MKFYSTNHISPEVGVKEAVLKGLPDDNGLFMPAFIPQLPKEFWDNSDHLTFNEIALEMAFPFFESEITKPKLKELIDQAFDFTAPSVKIDEDIYCLELFHGPSMAFKDFGARFMAAVMNYFLEQSDKKLNILVATSGDTGGAVAQGFYKSEHIDVTILYPKGKVSDIQEKQLTTLGENIRALEIDGTFDDCQKLVKTAFLDEELSSHFLLASANSINIARLIPQSFYYAYTYSRLKYLNKPLVFSVPSGNFGNLCAGLIAYKMGMPVAHFVAATNLNNVVPEYLVSGVYKAIVPSISTISNAMDVGNPSNFPRLKALFDNDLELLKDEVGGSFYDDEETRAAMKQIDQKYAYVCCPHTAVAYLGLLDFRKTLNKETIGVFLSTAHYAKFLPEVEPVIERSPEIPARLSELLSKQKESQLMTTDYEEFKSYLKQNLR